MHHEMLAVGAGDVGLDEKVAFLGRSASHPPSVTEVVCRETHMSWVFLAGDKAYKLKKPVRLAYLDFSTLERRESACRAELRLNRRLAPDVYLGLARLTHDTGGLAIDGDGPTVDWLVVMRRLDEHQTLERAMLERRVENWQLDRLADALVRFYRRAASAAVAPGRSMADWRQSLSDNHRILLDPRLGLPAGLVRRIDQVQRRFLDQRGGLLTDRIRSRHVVDGHGDLRPEHIWLGDPVRIIDCLEFNRRLRTVDPFDEIAFLSLECRRLGADWVGTYIRRKVARGLRDGVTEELFTFYRCHRAMLRARLAIAHLLEPTPRTPEKWPKLARVYLQIAQADALRLARLLRRQGGRSAGALRAGGGSSRRRAVQTAGCRACRKARHRPAETAEPYRR